LTSIYWFGPKGPKEDFNNTKKRIATSNL